VRDESRTGGLMLICRKAINDIKSTASAPNQHGHGSTFGPHILPHLLHCVSPSSRQFGGKLFTCLEEHGRHTFFSILTKTALQDMSINKKNLGV
jgi:hypothetical protein